MGETKWSDLPPELVFSIADRLPLSDYTRFRAVCRSWTSALGDFHPTSPFTHFPWLALVPSNVQCQPYFLDGDLHYRLPYVPVSVSVLCQKDGWLVIRQDNLQLGILNPLTGVQFPLPTLHTDMVIHRTILATTPSSAVSAFVFFIFRSHGSSDSSTLYFARPGDLTWTSLQRLFREQCEDIIYHEGRFYAMISSGKLLAFDLTGVSPPRPTLLAKKNALSNKSGRYRLSLVSSSGDLLQVRQNCDREFIFQRKHCHRDYFVIMKFDPDMDEWVRMMDLGGRSLFVDDSQAIVFCDSTQEVRRNCIYFPHGYVVGVYEAGEGTVSPCSVPDIHTRCYGSLLRKFWFMPSPLR